MSGLRLFKPETEQEFIPKTEELSLEELFIQANELGRVETGRLGRSGTVEITIKPGGDFIVVFGRTNNLKQSFINAIHKARMINQFYRDNEFTR